MRSADNFVSFAICPCTLIPSSFRAAAMHQPPCFIWIRYLAGENTSRLIFSPLLTMRSIYLPASLLASSLRHFVPLLAAYPAIFLLILFRHPYT
jgi:hypothetical protein